MALLSPLLVRLAVGRALAVLLCDAEALPDVLRRSLHRHPLALHQRLGLQFYLLVIFKTFLQKYWLFFFF